MSDLDDFDNGDYRYTVEGLTRDTGWVSRQQYVPASWTLVSGFPVAKLSKVRPDGKFRPQWQLVRTDYYVVKLRPDLLVTGVILGGNKPRVGFMKWNDKRVLKKHLVGYVWQSEPHVHVKHHDLERRAGIEAEWTSRCQFWPWDDE